MQGRSSPATTTVLRMAKQFASQNPAPGSGRRVSGGGGVMGAMAVWWVSRCCDGCHGGVMGAMTVWWVLWWCDGYCGSAMGAMAA